MRKTEAKLSLLDAMIELGLDPVAEFRFTKARRWRFDFAFPNEKLAVEIDGSGPGHLSDQGKRKDQEKRNAAVELGWKVLEYPAREVGVAKRLKRIAAQIQRVFCEESDADEFPFVLEGNWGD